jgi:hypothetical protein
LSQRPAFDASEADPGDNTLGLGVAWTRTSGERERLRKKRAAKANFCIKASGGVP